MTKQKPKPRKCFVTVTRPAAAQGRGAEGRRGAGPRVTGPRPAAGVAPGEPGAGGRRRGGARRADGRPLPAGARRAAYGAGASGEFTVPGKRSPANGCRAAALGSASLGDSRRSILARLVLCLVSEAGVHVPASPSPRPAMLLFRFAQESFS